MLPTDFDTFKAHDVSSHIELLENCALIYSKNYSRPLTQVVKYAADTLSTAQVRTESGHNMMTSHYFLPLNRTKLIAMNFVMARIS